MREAGSYEIYVGSSVADLRLTGRVELSGKTLPPEERPLSDYIQSESNIRTDHYKLEASCDPMKKSIVNYIFGAAALALAIVLELYCVLSGTRAVFFDLMALLLAVFGIFFFVREAVDRNRLYQEERRVIEERNEQAFETAEQIPVYQSGSMFAKEFDVTEEEVATEHEEQGEIVESDFAEHIDREQTFATAAREFALFAAEQGYELSEATVRRLFAALSTSRLVLFQGMEEQTFQTLLMLLSRYFGSQAYLDQVTDEYTDAAALLFGTDEHGTRIRTHAMMAIQAARNTPHTIHLAGLSGVRFASLTHFFPSYAAYVKNPAGNVHVKVPNENNVETTYYLPQNLWFMMRLAGEETLEAVPPFIAELSTVVSVSLGTCQPAPHAEELRGFSYHQMGYLAEKAAAAFEIREEAWKRVDRLEEYVNARSPYHIGNKMWYGLEQFAFTYLACEGDRNDALDEAVCATLLPSILTALCGKLSRDDLSLSEVMESFFGEGRVDTCRRMIKSSVKKSQ